MSARPLNPKPFTLYGRPGSGSAAVEALLALAGLPRIVVDVANSADDPNHAALLALNPLGQVPVLVLPNGVTMTESSAILMYLAEQAAPGLLAPPPGHANRPAYLRWMAYLSANLYMTELHIYYADRYSADPAGGPAVRQAAIARRAREWAVFAAAIGDGPFLFGKDPCAVDIYAAMIASWGDNAAELAETHPKLGVLSNSVAAIESITPIWQRHGLC